MKVDFIELTNFRGIQKQRIRFKNKNFVALIGDNASGKTTILEGITKGFVPVLRTINVEAMKECDLANKDIRNGANGTTVTLGITLDGEKYVWTNRRRLSSQQPFENNGDVKVEDVKSLKEDYKKKIINLIKIIGQDELVKRTGGKNKTIVFQKINTCTLESDSMREK